MASRFGSLYHGHSWSFHCCSGYCYWHTLLEAEIEVEQYLGNGSKVELEGGGGPTAQPQDTPVEYSVIGFMLGCSLAEAVARVVGLGETLRRIEATTPPPPPGSRT